ncbi:MAG: hypothetical protein KDC98_02400, partial [Planctomycetes bacterium]|nr:hypothetical protein [Planctomycetota bacterium]
VAAGGYFNVAGGMPASLVARWDGVAWHPFGAGLSMHGSYAVETLAVLSNGDLVAGGNVVYSGSTLVNNLARWDGTSWSPIDPNSFSLGLIHDVLPLPSGELVAVGFGSCIHAVGVDAAIWNGTAWTPLGPGTSSFLGTNNEIFALTQLANGDLVVAGDFKFAGGVSAWNVARWDGAAWHELSQGTDFPVYALAARANGGLVAGGSFASIEGVVANGVATSDGVSWSSLGSGMDRDVKAVAEMPNGDIIAGGFFNTAGGVNAPGVARWDGTAWHPLGSGLSTSSYQFQVHSCLRHSSGDLIVGGDFQFAGGVPVNGIARWDGASWSALGSGLSVGGPFGAVAKSLAELPNGDVVVGGFFYSVGGVAANHVARWDGVAWHALGSGSNYQVSALAVLPNGDLVANGYYAVAGGTSLARWDGSQWNSMGANTTSPVVKSLLPLPNGDLLVGGGFIVIGGVSTWHLARWSNGVWSDTGGVYGGYLNSGVNAMALLRNGSVALGGDFTLAGGQPSAFLAQWRSTCPATVLALANPCAGTAGPVALRSLTLPWIGSTFVSEASGFGPTALAASVFGFGAPGLPLGSLTPLAAPGCLQLATGDAVSITVPQAGALTYQLPIPNAASLAGQVLHQQYMQLEFGAGQPLLLSASNGLQLSCGRY